jgi:hypothetical protein
LFIVGLLTIFFAGSVPAEDLKPVFGLNVGYRIDDLRWNIAGNLSGQNPNILSELSWKDLSILQVEAFTKKNLSKSWYFQGSLSYGIIIGGKNQDSDYQGNNRTGEFSRSNNSSDGDDVMDTSFGVGCYLTPANSRIKFSPLIGYAFNWQNLRMTNGYQTINMGQQTGTPETTGPFSGLNSTYQAYWEGPWFGLNLEDTINPKWTIFGKFEYHSPNYTGRGNWNLRDDLAHPISFIHSANGDGYVGSVGADYSPNSRLKINFKLNFATWLTGNGTDRIFAANDGTDTTRLNKVNWNSEEMILTVIRKF